jgi:hypothetical protein
MPLGRFFTIAIALSVFGPVAALAQSCTAVDTQSTPDGGGCIGPSCGPSDAGLDQSVVDVDVPDSGGETGPPPTSPLCGAIDCLPDDPEACVLSAASADGGDPDASDAATTEPGYGCVVTRAPGGAPEAACVAVGAGATGAPCVSATDCAPGLACVGDGATAQCRPYCCDDPSSCEKGTYCAERSLKPEGDAGSGLSVPVCIPADNCSLDEPYPCPTGKQCKCKEGTACAVVKDDQTTSCVPPGDGRAGDPCPCAAGYVCSKSAQACLKLCSTTSANAECGSGKCQSVAYLPSGFGVCGLGGVDGG